MQVQAGRTLIGFEQGGDGENKVECERNFVDDIAGVYDFGDGTELRRCGALRQGILKPDGLGPDCLLEPGV